MKETLPKQLHLRTTGGMGITLEGSVDIDALPEDLAAQIQTELTPTRLSRVVRRKVAAFAPGQQEYEVTLVRGARAEPKRYAFTDQQADPELLDLMDELTSIIIEEKMRAKRARKIETKQDEKGAPGSEPEIVAEPEEIRPAIVATAAPDLREHDAPSDIPLTDTATSE